MTLLGYLFGNVNAEVDEGIERVMDEDHRRRAEASAPFIPIAAQIPPALHFLKDPDYFRHFQGPTYKPMTPKEVDAQLFADEKIEVAGLLAWRKARALTVTLLPSIFQSLQTRTMPTVYVFAAVAALYNEGYQPFVTELVPPADPTAEAAIPLDAILKKVSRFERRYQEDVSRWLIAAHFFEELSAFRQEHEEFFLYSPREYQADRYDPLVPETAKKGMAIILKWWPWIELVEQARESRTPFIDWKKLGADKLRF